MHHKLVDKGYTQKQAVTIMYIISAALGMFAIIMIYEGFIKSFLFLAFVTVVLLIGFNGIRNYKEDLIKDNIELGLSEKRNNKKKDNKKDKNRKGK